MKIVRLFVILVVATALSVLLISGNLSFIGYADNEKNKENISNQVNDDQNNNQQSSIPQTGPDEGDNKHPSGKDRSEEKGNSGSQGKSNSDPDGNSNSNGGTSGKDKIGFDGGADKHDQDNNNGCGNDDDFEDDNRGKCLGKKPTSTPKPSPTSESEPKSTPKKDHPRIGGPSDQKTKIDINVENNITNNIENNIENNLGSTDESNESSSDESYNGGNREENGAELGSAVAGVTSLADTGDLENRIARLLEFLGLVTIAISTFYTYRVKKTNFPITTLHEENQPLYNYW